MDEHRLNFTSHSIHIYSGKQIKYKMAGTSISIFPCINSSQTCIYVGGIETAENLIQALQEYVEKMKHVDAIMEGESNDK